jgi:hypothetical protein
MGRVSESRFWERRAAVAGVVLLALCAALVVALVSRGDSAEAADHLEAPIVSLGLVSSEMSPVKPFAASGIVHLSSRPAGSRETITATFAGLVPKATYELALTRGTCRAMGDVHGFFDLGAELALTAGSRGSIAVDKAMDLTRPNPQGVAKTAILRRAGDNRAVACGPLLSFKRAG